MNDTKTIVSFLNDFLNIGAIQDYSINGLQVEGCAGVSKIGLAVDACAAVYEAAVEAGCQMVIVHHGIVWGGIQSITGPLRQQIKILMDNDLNLYACHLPLDLHPECGNNAVLANMLGIKKREPFGIYKGKEIGFSGSFTQTLSAEKIAHLLQTQIGGAPHTLPFGPVKNKTIGIVSGGGSDCIPEAIEKGLDCLITGESSHEDHHRAAEGKINVIYSGHYNTETVGVQALGPIIKERLDVETTFLDIPTLV